MTGARHRDPAAHPRTVTRPLYAGLCLADAGVVLLATAALLGVGATPDATARATVPLPTAARSVTVEIAPGPWAPIFPSNMAAGITDVTQSVHAQPVSVVPRPTARAAATTTGRSSTAPVPTTPAATAPSTTTPATEAAATPTASPTATVTVTTAPSTEPSPTGLPVVDPIETEETLP